MMTAPARAAPDEHAFKAELVALIPHLRAFARSLCGDPAVADDLAQEAMLKAWASRAQFKPGTNMKAWTFMILRNLFYSLKRRDWRQADWDQEKAERTLIANASPDAALELDDLRRALNELPDDQREALILVGGGGLAYDEAAEICGCAVGTIKSRVSRARKALDAILAAGEFSSEDDGVSAVQAMDAILDDAERIATNNRD